MALYENGKRISGIRDFPAYTWAEYHALPAAQRPKVWKCTDRDYTEIPRESVSVTADGNKTWATLLNELFALIDSTKITYNTKLTLDVSGIKFEYPLVRNANNTIFAFSGPVEYNVNGYYNHYYSLKSTGSERWSIVLTSSITRTDNSSTALTSGAVISVIY